MTEQIKQRRLEQELIRAFALADEWFDMLHRLSFNNRACEKIESCLSDLGSQLQFLKSLPIQETEQFCPDALSRDDMEQLREIIKTNACSNDSSLVADVSYGENTFGLRQKLRDHLYQTLILLEVDSAIALKSQVVGMPDGRVVSTEQFLQLMVYIMNRILFELSLLKADEEA